MDACPAAKWCRAQVFEQPRDLDPLRWVRFHTETKQHSNTTPYLYNMQVFEQPGDPDPLRWVRFSTDPCTADLAPDS
jgi:hypothetical protein